MFPGTATLVRTFSLDGSTFESVWSCAVSSKNGAGVGIHGDAVHRSDVDLGEHVAARSIDYEQSFAGGMRGVRSMVQLVDRDVIESAEDRNGLRRRGY